MRSRSPLDPPAEQTGGYRPQRAKSRIDKAMQALARSPVGGWLFINVFPMIDRWLIPLSRGRLKVAMGQPILLLHTRGARSDQPRTSPLLYTPRGDALVVVASKARGSAPPGLVLTTSARIRTASPSRSTAPAPPSTRALPRGLSATRYGGWSTTTTTATTHTKPERVSVASRSSSSSQRRIRCCRQRGIDPAPAY